MATKDLERQRGYQRAWYHRNKHTPEYRAAANARGLAHKQHKREAKQLYLAERGCRDCGEEDPVVLQFHHTDAADKHQKLKENGGYWIHLSWDALFAEMEKCVVLCANCHFREEALLRLES